MPLTIKHYYYPRLDPSAHPEPALFKVFEGDELVAVVREPQSFPLINEPVPDKNYRVDCREVTSELRTFLAGYFLTRTFAFFDDPGWMWNDNGTYEERP
jgi:hypothetical protein